MNLKTTNRYILVPLEDEGFSWNYESLRLPETSILKWIGYMLVAFLLFNLSQIRLITAELITDHYDIAHWLNLALGSSKHFVLLFARLIVYLSNQPIRHCHC